MKKNNTIVIFVILLVLFVFFSVQLGTHRDILLDEHFIEYTMPSKIIGPASMEFKGIVSDFLLFKFMTFIGGKVAQNVPISQEQWGHLVNTLDTITDLDPYFWDAYMFSETFLAWDARRVKDANRILLKGTEYLKNDYRVYYYLGFNYYYFLKDNKTAQKFLEKAAKLPGASIYIAKLASRLSVMNFKHKDGIAFLKEMLKGTRDKAVRNQFEMRIVTLQIMDFLEQKVTEYHKVYQRYPEKIDQLVESGLISSLPKDPYGGEFIIMANGRVYTTSEMRSLKKDKNTKQ